MTPTHHAIRLISKYGRRVKITKNGSDIWCSAFIQPFLNKNRQYLSGSYKPEGFDNSKYFVYLGPPEQDLRTIGTAGYITDSEDIKYYVQRAEMVYFKNEPYYCWALLKT